MKDNFYDDQNSINLLLVLERLQVITTKSYNEHFDYIIKRKLKLALAQLRSNPLNPQDGLSKL